MARQPMLNQAGGTAADAWAPVRVAGLSLLLAVIGVLLGMTNRAAGAWVVPPATARIWHSQAADPTPVAPPAAESFNSDAMAALHAEANDLRRLIQATRELMAVYAQGTPTPEELAAVHAQVEVIQARLAQWKADVLALKNGGDPAAVTLAPSSTAPAVTPVATASPAPVLPAAPPAPPADAASNVKVTVTPRTLHDPTLDTLDFYVTLSTHSVDLSQNLATLAALRLPSGAEVPAIGWDGPTGGHHIEGTLSFPVRNRAGARLLPAAGTLSLILRGVGDLPERVFVLELDQVP